MPIIENGENISLTRANFKQYLSLLANFKLVKRFEHPLESFLSGFNSVFSFDIIKKRFAPHEVGFLTCGLRDLNPESIVDMIRFPRSNPRVEGWFKDYIRSYKPDALRVFLKYITGSSTIPAEGISLRVDFKNEEDPEHLPIAHTCFKSVEMPLYRSYEELERKFTIAIANSGGGFELG